MIPLTEALKAEERLEKVRSHQAGKSGGRPPRGAVSGEGLRAGGHEDRQQPVEFVHIKTPGRNYAVLQVGCLFFCLKCAAFNFPRRIMPPSTALEEGGSFVCSGSETRSPVHTPFSHKTNFLFSEKLHDARNEQSHGKCMPGTECIDTYEGLRGRKQIRK